MRNKYLLGLLVLGLSPTAGFAETTGSVSYDGNDLGIESLQVDYQEEIDKPTPVPAPGFTLENTYGKEVSLSDFKGKWVILDFWGSWCIWCIKGFPELKDAYNTYAGKLEVIGIDCRETKQEWLDGLARYQLPWVNLYCPDGNPLFREYGIQGFPTKVIIDPEGMVRNVTIGHNPEFFTILDTLMAE